MTIFRTGHTCCSSYGLQNVASTLFPGTPPVCRPRFGIAGGKREPTSLDLDVVDDFGKTSNESCKRGPLRPPTAEILVTFKLSTKGVSTVDLFGGDFGRDLLTSRT